MSVALGPRNRVGILIVLSADGDTLAVGALV